MISAVQSKMARAALGWSTIELAKRAGVGVATVNRFETGQATTIQATLAAMQRAFEVAGVVFLNDEGEPGVRLRKVATEADSPAKV